MPGTDMSAFAAPAGEHDRNEPVTFHRVMQSMIGDGLKARYVPPKKLSHELFVLMLQLRDREQRENEKTAKSQKAKSPKAQKAKTPKAASSKAGAPRLVAASL